MIKNVTPNNMFNTWCVMGIPRQSVLKKQQK